MRLSDAARNDVEAIKQIPVDTKDGNVVPLQAIATVQDAKGPNIINRENAQRRIVIQANVSDRDLFMAKYSLNKWIRRVERVLTSLLPPSTQVVKLNREGLLEATTLQRYQAHKLALDGGWMLPSEVRTIEDLPPIAGIDDRKPNSASSGVTSGNAA